MLVNTKRFWSSKLRHKNQNSSASKIQLWWEKTFVRIGKRINHAARFVKIESRHPCKLYGKFRRKVKQKKSFKCIYKQDKKWKIQIFWKIVIREGKLRKRKIVLFGKVSYLKKKFFI